MIMNYLNLMAFRRIKNSSTIEEMVHAYDKFVEAEQSETDRLLKFLEKHNITDKEYIFMELIYPHYSDVILPSHYIFNYKEVANTLNIQVDVIVSILNTFSYQPKEDEKINIGSCVSN